jgi:hypothetical protein
MVGWLKRPRRVAAGPSSGNGSRRRKNKCVILALLGLLGLLPSASVISAELSRPTEYELKAAFLYNFIKFTEWPTEELGKSADPFVIGILGKDPFGQALDKIIEGETVHNKRVVAKRLTRAEEALNCHALFISSSEESNLPRILGLLDGQSVLTVGEIKNFAGRGGVIYLKEENKRLVFEINLEAAKRAGLVMSAQLLKVAKIVKGNS